MTLILSILCGVGIMFGFGMGFFASQCYASKKTEKNSKSQTSSLSISQSHPQVLTSMEEYSRMNSEENEQAD